MFNGMPQSGAHLISRSLQEYDKTLSKNKACSISFTTSAFFSENFQVNSKANWAIPTGSTRFWFDQSYLKPKFVRCARYSLVRNDTHAFKILNSHCVTFCTEIVQKALHQAKPFKYTEQYFSTQDTPFTGKKLKAKTVPTKSHSQTA
jgi:hypothetical protein